MKWPWFKKTAGKAVCSELPQWTPEAVEREIRENLLQFPHRLENLFLRAKRHALAEQICYNLFQVGPYTFLCYGNGISVSFVFDGQDELVYDTHCGWRMDGPWKRHIPALLRDLLDAVEAADEERRQKVLDAAEAAWAEYQRQKGVSA